MSSPSCPRLGPEPHPSPSRLWVLPLPPPGLRLSAARARPAPPARVWPVAAKEMAAAWDSGFRGFLRQKQRELRARTHRSGTWPPRTSARAKVMGASPCRGARWIKPQRGQQGAGGRIGELLHPHEARYPRLSLRVAQDQAPRDRGTVGRRPQAQKRCVNEPFTAPAQAGAPGRAGVLLHVHTETAL